MYQFHTYSICPGKSLSKKINEQKHHIQKIKWNHTQIIKGKYQDLTSR